MIFNKSRLLWRLLCQQGASIPNSTPLKNYYSLYIPQGRVLLKSLNWTITNTLSPRITVNFTIGIFLIPQLPLTSRTLSTWRSIHATQCSLFDLADSCRSVDYISGGSPRYSWLIWWVEVVGYCSGCFVCVYTGNLHLLSYLILFVLALSKWPILGTPLSFQMILHNSLLARLEMHIYLFRISHIGRVETENYYMPNVHRRDRL